jgi:UDP-2-acetamido-2-deoxy-ribo-hexuluronate aminotransferase
MKIVNNREQLQKRLRDEDITTAVHYPIPLNEQEAYKHLCCPDCTPIAKQLAKQVMSLPICQYLKPDIQNQIICLILSIIGSEYAEQ